MTPRAARALGRAHAGRSRRGTLPNAWRAGPAAQELPRERYEVIVVGSGAEREVEELVAAAAHLRRPVASVPGPPRSSSSTTTARGRREGAGCSSPRRTPWPSPTASHRCSAICRPTSRVWRAPASAPTATAAENPVAKCEQRWYAEGFEEWSREGDWRKVTIRGFAIRRDAYLDAGGFEHRFGCFAETALAANAGRARLPAGLCGRRPRSSTTTRPDIGPLLRYVREYREGEIAYRATAPREYCERYFGVLPPLLDRREPHQDLVWVSPRAGALPVSAARRRRAIRRVSCELWTRASDWEQQRAHRTAAI